MASNSSSVLRVNGVEEQAAYRNAVAEILRRIQSDEGTTLLEISERIDVSLGTISNAANRKSDLSPAYLKRLGVAYGVHQLDPYAALMGGRFVPIAPDNVRDLLPLLQRAGLRIAEARDPAGPGGVREIHTEKKGYLPDLRDLMRELEAAICAIETELAA